jgi:hypothetical protein
MKEYREEGRVHEYMKEVMNNEIKKGERLFTLTSCIHMFMYSFVPVFTPSSL